MKKYLLLTILPILASCTSTPSSTKLSDIPERPSKDGADYAETNLNKDLAYPHKVVDRSANSSLDVTEDSAGLISGVGTRQVRNYGNTVVRSTRRGSHIVRKEGTRYAEVVYDAGDQVADVAHDETIAYGGFIDNGGSAPFTLVAHSSVAPSRPIQTASTALLVASSVVCFAAPSAILRTTWSAV